MTEGIRNVTLNVPEDALHPENDLQELWMLNGRVAGLRGMVLAEIKNNTSGNPIVYAKDVCAIMGWKYEE